MSDSSHLEKLQDDLRWNRIPFIIDLDKTQNAYFSSTTEMLEHVLETNVSSNGGTSSGALLSTLLATGDNEALPPYANKPLLTDTRLGWNDALNPLWQFNKDDDIMYPLTMSDSYHGMGRVYHDTIERNQRILYLTFGVPEFSGLLDFYTGALDMSIANLMRNGDGDIINSIADLFGTSVGFAIKAPFLPLHWLKRLLTIRQYRITKYYDFKSTMPLFYTAVTGMLVKLTVNMGLTAGWDPDFNGQPSTEPVDKEALPILLQVTKPDIFTIIMQRATARMSTNNDLLKMGKTSTDLLRDLHVNDADLAARQKIIYGGDEEDGKASRDSTLLASSNEPTISRFFSTFTQGLTNTALGGIAYIGFRIDKSVDASESFSNSTGESSVAQKLNSSASASRDSLFSVAYGKTGVDVLDTISSAVGHAVAGLGSTLNVGALLNTHTGHSFIDIPEVWEGSTFGKSYSFNFALRAPYGDPISIYQSIYVPLCVILAGSLPRATGNASYTSPFLLRAYCKGMFAIPLGIIESLSIQRGSSEFGWNVSSLPTQVDVSISIKDLAPALYYGIGSGGLLDSIDEVYAQNSTFNEYLMTLAGMGLADRILFSRNIKRRISILMQTQRSTRGNPYYWAAMIGDSTLGQAIGALIPFNALPVENH